MYGLETGNGKQEDSRYFKVLDERTDVSRNAQENLNVANAGRTQAPPCLQGGACVRLTRVFRTCRGRCAPFRPDISAVVRSALACHAPACRPGSQGMPAMRAVPVHPPGRLRAGCDARWERATTIGFRGAWIDLKSAARLSRRYISQVIPPTGNQFRGQPKKSLRVINCRPNGRSWASVSSLPQAMIRRQRHPIGHVSNAFRTRSVQASMNYISVSTTASQWIRKLP